MSRDPKPLANRNFRRMLIVNTAIYTALVGFQLAVAIVVATVPAWSYVAALVMLSGGALFGMAAAYKIGWWARSSDEYERTAGRWISYPVDADGIPTTAPLSGRFVVDDEL